jgi:putative salt-induced outer membrane protein YdiY
MFVALLAVPFATAADPAFVGADAAGQAFEKPETHLAAQLGGAFTTGNTQTYALNASLVGDHKWMRNKGSLSTGANLGRSILDANGDGHLDDAERAAGWAENARKAWIDARYDRFVGKKNSLYLLTGGLLDPFAGYDSRVHAQLGYSRVLVGGNPITPVGGDPTALVAELGVDGAREDFVDGVDPNTAYVIAGRVMVGLTHKFSDNVAFSDKVEVYENLLTPIDLRVLNVATLSAKLTDKFTLNLGHNLTFDNEPVEGFQPLDQATTVTFMASIL